MRTLLETLNIVTQFEDEIITSRGGTEAQWDAQCTDEVRVYSKGHQGRISRGLALISICYDKMH